MSSLDSCVQFLLCRNLTRLAGKLLADGQEMIGRRPNQQELAEMRSRHNNFNHTGDAMKNAIAQSGY
jgi:hypothetical protein